MNNGNYCGICKSYSFWNFKYFCALCNNFYCGKCIFEILDTPITQNGSLHVCKTCIRISVSSRMDVISNKSDVLNRFSIEYSNLIQYIHVLENSNVNNKAYNNTNTISSSIESIVDNSKTCLFIYTNSSRPYANYIISNVKPNLCNISIDSYIYKDDIDIKCNNSNILLVVIVLMGAQGNRYDNWTDKPHANIYEKLSNVFCKANITCCIISRGYPMLMSSFMESTRICLGY